MRQLSRNVNIGVERSSEELPRKIAEIQNAALGTWPLGDGLPSWGSISSSIGNVLFYPHQRRVMNWVAHSSFSSSSRWFYYDYDSLFFLSLFSWWIDEWHTLNAFVLACFTCNGCFHLNRIFLMNMFCWFITFGRVFCLEKPPIVLIQSLFYPQNLRPHVRSPVERCDTYWWYDMTIGMAII